MTGDGIRTAADLRASIVDQRGGISCFDGPQRRLLDALVVALARRPDEIDVRTVTDLMAMLPRPVSAPGRDDRDNHEAVAPLLKLYRYLHEQVHALSAENARLRASLGLKGLPDVSNRLDTFNPTESDICPPNERVECDAGPNVGPDDPPPRSTAIIEAKANPLHEPQPRAAPAKPAWEDWLDVQQGGAHYDRWANRNGT
jgi:hypothetical protein